MHLSGQLLLQRPLDGRCRLESTLTIDRAGRPLMAADITSYELHDMGQRQVECMGDDLLDAEIHPRIEGLAPGAKYYYALRASNSMGSRPVVGPSPTAVAKLACPTLRTLDADSCNGRNSIKLTWTARQQWHNHHDGYELQYRWLVTTKPLAPATDLLGHSATRCTP